MLGKLKWDRDEGSREGGSGYLQNCFILKVIVLSSAFLLAKGGCPVEEGGSEGDCRCLEKNRSMLFWRWA